MTTENLFVHFLDALSIWGKEFASALSSMVPAIGWIPEVRWHGAFERWKYDHDLDDPPLRAKCFPIQRGYRRWPIGLLSRTPERLQGLLASVSPPGQTPVLIATSPYYTPLAERWNGPVIYYVTDLLAKYGGFHEGQVRALDKRMCRAAWLVCPNSDRIANYLREHAECQPSKITVVPNATRRQNLLPFATEKPAALPPDISDLVRPVAGVIGNLAANLDWELLEETVDITPWLSWVFVGPVRDNAGSPPQQRSRASLMRRGGRIRFIGAKPYGDLRNYARAFDVAVIPYRKAEPTYSGSSTRFYEHLAACRPIVSTTGFAELLSREPLLRLASDARSLASHLNDLRDAGFRDGYAALRWETSLHETWEARAESMLSALLDKSRLPREKGGRELELVMRSEST